MRMDARMLSHYFLFPLLPIIIAVNEMQFSSAESCNNSDLTWCMKGLNLASHNEDLAFALTEEELNKICGQLQDAMKCVNSFTSRCLASAQIEIYKAVTFGAQKLLSDLCTRGSDFQRLYLQHAGCYKNLSGEYKKCADTYMKEQETVKHLDMENDEKIQKSCCLFNGYKQCTRAAILTKCTEEAADMGENIVTMVGGPLVHVQCSTFKHDSPYCSSASSLHFSGLTLCFSLWFVLAKQRLIPIQL